MTLVTNIHIILTWLAKIIQGGVRMDYEKLASEFMQELHLLKKVRPHHQLNEAMHGEAFVIQYLSRRNSSVLPSEISQTMGISTARIAATLNSLEKKGLITRQIDLSDRRRILVDITPAGKELAKERHEEILERMTKLLASLGEDDAKEFVRITRKLVKNMDKFKEECKNDK